MHQVYILFGGTSDERLVSVATAQNIARNLTEATLLFWQKDDSVAEVYHSTLLLHEKPFTQEFPAQSKIFVKNIVDLKTYAWNKDAVIFLALHCERGENGFIQSILENAGVAFTGSSSLSSKLSFDKIQTKQVAKQHSIEVAPDVSFFCDKESFEKTSLKLFSFLNDHGKCMIKPTCGGSSLGLYRVTNPDQLNQAIKNIYAFAPQFYLAEKMVEGREMTVGIIFHEGKNLALPASEVKLTESESFDYQGKYLGKGAVELTPAPIDDASMQKCQKLALLAHKVLGCEGYSRTDMILTHDGPVFLETNTLPGLTQASFLPQQLYAAAISFQTFLAEQVDTAIKRKNKS